MTKHQLGKAIEQANARGLGQFHVWDGMSLTTWHSFRVAVAVANKTNGVVYNMDFAQIS